MATQNEYYNFVKLRHAFKNGLQIILTALQCYVQETWVALILKFHYTRKEEYEFIGYGINLESQNSERDGRRRFGPDGQFDFEKLRDKLVCFHRFPCDRFVYVKVWLFLDKVDDGKNHNPWLFLSVIY